MSKRRKKTYVSNFSPPRTREALQMRDAPGIARRAVVHPLGGVLHRKPDFNPIQLRSLEDVTDLRQVEDRRLFSPSRQGRFLLLNGQVARFGYVPIRNRMHGLRGRMSLTFHEPRQVSVCVRRSQRKRVLFALQRVGKGRKISPARWSAVSYIRCK